MVLFLPFEHSKRPKRPIYSSVMLQIKLAPWWPKQKNKATFNIYLAPIYKQKIVLFLQLDPSKRQKRPILSSG